MTPNTPPAEVKPQVTLDDIRHRANAVKSMAVTDAKDAVDTVMSQSATRTLIAVGAMVVVAASLAFYLGSRSSGGSAE